MGAILTRYIVSETLKAFVGITGVFLLFYVSNRLIGLLADAAAGDLPADYVFLLLGLKTAGNLVLLLPAMCFVALLLTFGRLYQDNEMAVLAACGVGRREVLKASFWFSVPAAIAVTLFALWVAPWLKTVEKETEYRAEQEADTLTIQAGRFKIVDAGGVVFFAEQIDPDSGELRSVFMQGRQGAQPLWVVADSARLEREADGSRVLRLTDGTQYEGVIGQADFRVTGFSRYDLYNNEPEAGPTYARAAGKATAELLASTDPGDRAELHWRISFPVFLGLLAVLALPLSYSAPRQGRYGKLVLALVLYVLYANLLTLAKSWLSRGITPEWLGLWWVHGLVAGCALVWWLLRRRTGGGL